MNNHPHLKILHSLYLKETQSFRKVHRMIDLFESIIKTHTVVIVCEYVKHNQLSDSAKGLLAQGLRTPSLGTWQLFSRVLFEELQKDNYEYLLCDFPNEFLFLDKALNSDKTNVIAMRNGYAHGATPSDDDCEIDIKKFDPFLTQLMELKWLVTSTLEVQNGKVTIVNTNGSLSLHPMLLYRKEDSDASFAFFNDLKNDKVGLLNYPLGKHYREKDFFTEFQEYLPLQDWKKIGNNEFYQRIEELTETFKGRTIEREKLLQFVSTKSKGYFSIQGNPGIGKSALIAQFFKDLRAHDALKKLHIVEYFIRRGTQQAQVEYLLNYLIRRTDEYFPAGKEIRAEGKMVFDLQNQLFAKWRLWSEHSKGQKILFLIDGLDEGVENDVVTYLPRENFENILIIYGSRPGGHKTIDDLWATLPTEYHTKLELYGLGKEDIRALIYEVANKYEIDRESSWIDAVHKRSQGNPLYLRLLCDAVENGSIGINDINALPKEIDEYYKAILQRYAQDAIDGDALLTGLFTFAAAKDYLTVSHLGLINKLGSATVQRIGSTLKEVLYENPLTEEILDYQLFHESFREYLVKEKAKEVRDASDRIIAFCDTWQELEGNWEQCYALEHYATHLSESKKAQHHEVLMNLIYDEEYAREQIKTLKSFDSSNRLFQLTLLKASELKKEEHLLEAALCLIDLRYDEANDAPQVVAMVANNEIDLALKRIESFGGADEEGVKRRFVLYILCLMELTMLESKNKPFRKSGIEKLLNHLDEHTPTDTSIINWIEFFPSFTMFLMACEWQELGLDYLLVYKRTDECVKNWVKYFGLLSDKQFSILINITLSLSDINNVINTSKIIIAELGKKGEIDQLKNLRSRISGLKSNSSKNIISWGNNIKPSNKNINSVFLESLDESNPKDLINSAFEFYNNISNDEWKLKLSYLREIIFSKNAKKINLSTFIRIFNAYVNLNFAKTITDEEIPRPDIKSRENYMIIELSQWLFNFVKENKGNESEKSFFKKIILAIENPAIKLFFKIQLIDELSIQDNNSNINSVFLECCENDNSFLIFNFFEKLIELNMCEYALEFCNKFKKKEYDLYLNSYRVSRYHEDWVLNSMTLSLLRKGASDEAIKTVQRIQNSILKANSLIILLEDLKLINTEIINNGIFQAFCKNASEIGDIYELIKVHNSLLEKIIVKDFDLEFINRVIEYMYELKYTVNNKNLFWCKVFLASATFVEKEKNIKLKGFFIQRAYAETLNIKDKHTKYENLIDIISSTKDFDKYFDVDFILEELENDIKLMPEIERHKGFLGDFNEILGKIVSIRLSQNKFHKAIESAQGISGRWIKPYAIKSIITVLAQHGKIEEALECSKGIIEKSDALHSISSELTKQGKIEEALDCASGISEVYSKCSALKYISNELTKLGNWQLAESIVLEITLVSERHIFWETLAANRYKEIGWQKALQEVNQLKNEEARLFYLKGWTEAVSLEETDAVCVQEALSHLAHDSENIENLLQKYALHELFFGNIDKELVHRLNKSLNIQWALDIQTQFPKQESTSRLSSNLDTWLHEIADEDDRDDIKSWAEKVKDGKMLEDKFSEKVKNMN